MGGNRELSELIATHGVWLSALLRGLTRREADAEDAYQEVWLRLFKAGGLPKGASPRAYLATSARSVVIDRYRREGREELLSEGEDAETLGGELTEETTPATRFEAHATHEEILAAVRRLPVGPRTVVLLRIEGELTFQEIADELNIPLGTALTWMRGATRKLRELLGGGK